MCHHPDGQPGLFWWMPARTYSSDRAWPTLHRNGAYYWDVRKHRVVAAEDSCSKCNSRSEIKKTCEIPFHFVSDGKNPSAHKKHYVKLYSQLPVFPHDSRLNFKILTLTIFCNSHSSSTTFCHSHVRKKSKIFISTLWELELIPMIFIELIHSFLFRREGRKSDEAIKSSEIKKMIWELF